MPAHVQLDVSLAQEKGVEADVGLQYSRANALAGTADNKQEDALSPLLPGSLWVIWRSCKCSGITQILQMEQMYLWTLYSSVSI